MSIDLDQLEIWLKSKEDEHLEFKEAKERYDFEELVKYCAALANEGGGTMVLGITDRRPRQIVGTRAFQETERTKAGLVERLCLRIAVDEIDHPAGRVLAFKVPSRPLGMAVEYKGAYWMRPGSDLAPMTQDQLRNIFLETGPDFSAEICKKSSLADLHPEAIQRLREFWRRKSGNHKIEHLSNDQLLRDAELLANGAPNHAALVLLGTREALGRHLAQAEVIFEYRSSEAAGPAQQRKEYREGFFLFQDDLWSAINLRNDKQHYQDGLLVWDIPAYDERVVREAILNAVSHRDYRLSGSIFIRQYPKRLEIVSPGGFPPGINERNILDKQAPRNRRIAEVLVKCGFVERSGQGVNLMFEHCIRESKPRPDFAGTDEYQVFLTLRGEVQNPLFLRFLERINKETLSSFITQDFLVLDMIAREEPVPRELRDRLRFLKEEGIVETIGRGKGTRPILSRRFYTFLGKKGVYTRKRGLDRETNKELLLKHIEDYQEEGSRLEELVQVLPSLSVYQVQRLLRDLKAEGRIHNRGTTKAAR